ncbi:hypothetical protein ACR6C2_20480 [Streptomyces sp. INA 01156]
MTEPGADLLDLPRLRRALSVHYGDHTVFRSPLEDLLAEAGRRGHDTRLLRCALVAGPRSSVTGYRSPKAP